MKRILHNIIFLGVNSNLSLSLAKRIVLANQVSLTIFFIVVFFGMAWASIGHTPGVIYNLTLAPFYILCLWLNHKNFYNLSRFLLLSSINLWIFWFVGQVGKSTDSHISFFTLAGLSFIIYEPRERIGLSFGIGLPVLLYSVLVYFNFNIFENKFGDTLPTAGTFTYLANFLMVILAMFYLSKATEKAEKQLHIINNHLQESQKFLESILDNLPMLFFTKDLSGNFLRVNPEFANFFDNADEHKAFWDLHDSTVLKNKESHQFETTLLKNGKYHTYICIKFPIFDMQGEVSAFGCICNDITELIETQKMVEKERARSMHSMKIAAVGEMAGGMAHEINNPLTTISLSIDQLQRKLIKENFNKEDFDKNLRVINLQVQRIASIIKSLRLLSNVSNSSQKETIDLSKQSQSVLELFRERLKKHGIDLRENISEESLKVRGNVAEIFQVLFNIIQNAYEASLESPNPWISFQLSREDDRVRIHVSDSGAGIPLGLRDKLFHPFFTTKIVGKGLGLGLSTSKAIIEAHQGRIWIDFTAPHTSFIIELPLVADS